MEVRRLPCMQKDCGSNPGIPHGPEPARGDPRAQSQEQPPSAANVTPKPKKYRQREKKLTGYIKKLMGEKKKGMAL